MSCTPGRAHTPLKSGLPLASRGAGAFMSTLLRADCAATVVLSATRRPIAQTDVLMTELLPVGQGARLWAGLWRHSTVVLGAWYLVRPWFMVRHGSFRSRSWQRGPRTMDQGRGTDQARGTDQEPKDGPR